MKYQIHNMNVETIVLSFYPKTATYVKRKITASTQLTKLFGIFFNLNIVPNSRRCNERSSIRSIFDNHMSGKKIIAETNEK